VYCELSNERRHAVTRAMALELAPVVRVNAISPDYVLTPMQRTENTDSIMDGASLE